MQEEPAELVAREFVYPHFIAAGAERGGHQCLRFAAGEQRGTVRARQYAHLDADGPDFVQGPAVHALVGLNDVFAHEPLLQVAEYLAHHGAALFPRLLAVFLEELLFNIRLERVDCVVALLLDHDGLGAADAVCRELFDVRHHLRVGFRRLEDHLLDADALAQFLDGFDDLLDVPMGKLQRVDHGVFGNLAGLAFHHADGVGRAGHDDVERALVHVAHVRVGHEFVFDQRHADSADGLEQRNLGNVERRGCGVHRDYVGVVNVVGAEHRLAHLQFIEEALREQGAQGAVGHAAHENLAFRRARFPPEEAAGNAPGGVKLLPVVHGHGEKTLARPGFRGDGHRREDHGLAHGAHDCSVGLLGDSSGFEMQLVRADCH